MVKYYNFLILNVFLVFTIGPAMLVYLETLANNPQEALYKFALEISSGGAFFLNWLIINLVSFPVSLLGPFKLLYIIAKRLSFTPRTLSNIQFYTSYVSFGVLYPINILALTITLVYSPIQPLITIPATIYFAIAWVVYKHQFLNVYIKEFDGQGRHSKNAVGYIIFGLILMQIVFIGVLSSKKPSYGMWISLILVPITLYFWRLCFKRFFRKLGVVPFCYVSDESVDHGFGVGNSVLMLVNSPQEKSLDPNLLAKINADDRHASTYLNPLLSQKLCRPWIPDVLADWIRSGDLNCVLTKVDDDDFDDAFENKGDLQDLKDRECGIDQEENEILESATFEV